MKSLIRQQTYPKIRFAVMLTAVFLMAVISPFTKRAMSRSNDAGSFRRIVFLPEKQNEQGSYFFDFNGEVVARLMKQYEIPVFYVDFLGGTIETSPFVMNFSHGPAKMVRLTQISKQPMVVRSTFFLRKPYVPELKNGKRGPVISFKPGKENERKKTSNYSLIPPVSQEKNREKPQKPDHNEPIKLKISGDDIGNIYRELGRKAGKIVYIRDSVIKPCSISLTADNPIDAIEKIAKKYGQVVSFEDQEIWISNPENPLLMIPQNFMIDGADLNNLALADVLRAMGQIAEKNIVLDPSMKEIQEKPVSMYLKKQSVRRGIETLLKLHDLKLEKVDNNTLLVLTQKRAREIEGKVVRVYSPVVPVESLVSLLESAIEDDVKQRVKIEQDLGNIIFIGDSFAVEKLLGIISGIEAKLENAKEGVKRQVFQAINTEVEELIRLTNETLDEKEKIKIVHDKRTDRIILTGSANTVDKAVKMMESLDHPETRQALINIKLLEVSRGALEDIGIDLPQTLVSTDNIGHIKSADYIIPAKLVAFIENTDAKTLANPTIRCMDKEESTIDISEQIPVKNTVTEYLPVASASLAARTTDNWTTSDVGIKMNIKPVIHENDEISMDVDIDQTELISLVEGHPWTAKRQIKTKVRVADRETVVIGGLIRKKKTENRKPIPLLHKIPILNKLFRSVERQNNNKESVELVVLITPSVVGIEKNDEQEIRSIKDKTRLTAGKVED